MELLSVFTNIINLLKNSGALVLRKLGYKIVPFDDYNEEEFPVDCSFPNQDPTCLNETKAGANFNWSEKYPIGYEKYYQINGNTRRYFKWNKQHLWIKRNNLTRPQ